MCFIDDFTIFTTFYLHGMLHVKFIIQKKTCFIDLKQTGRLRIPYIVKHFDAFWYAFVLYNSFLEKKQMNVR